MGGSIMTIRKNTVAMVAVGIFACQHAYAQTAAGQTGKPVAAARAATGTASASDKNFVIKAGMGGQAEVELGTLAQQKATDPKVKALGERMETDHKKANADLQTIATEK